jgi:hypothetical protein
MREVRVKRREVSNYADVSTFQGQRYQITLMLAVLEGKGISDYAYVSTFQGQRYQITLMSAILSGGGYQIIQSALLEGRGIRLHTSQLQKRKVSNFGEGYHVTTKYQISTKISDYNRISGYMQTPFCNINIFDAILRRLYHRYF